MIADQIQAAILALRYELGRGPTEREIAEHLAKAISTR